MPGGPYADVFEYINAHRDREQGDLDKVDIKWLTAMMDSPFGGIEPAGSMNVSTMDRLHRLVDDGWVVQVGVVFDVSEKLRTNRDGFEVLVALQDIEEI